MNCLFSLFEVQEERSFKGRVVIKIDIVLRYVPRQVQVWTHDVQASSRFMFSGFMFLGCVGSGFRVQGFVG